MRDIYGLLDSSEMGRMDPLDALERFWTPVRMTSTFSFPSSTEVTSVCEPSVTPYTTFRLGDFHNDRCGRSISYLVSIACQRIHVKHVRRLIAYRYEAAG